METTAPGRLESWDEKFQRRHQEAHGLEPKYTELHAQLGQPSDSSPADGCGPADKFEGYRRGGGQGFQHTIDIILRA